MNQLSVVYKGLNEIRPYEKNPRRNDAAVDKVAASIKSFGFKVPIVVDADGVIVAGHTRYKAARKLGFKTVPCVVASDLTPDQVKAFRLADNKVSELAEWDFEMMNEELAELANIEDFAMADFGFYMVKEEDNFDHMFDQNYTAPTKPAEEPAPAVEKPADPEPEPEEGQRVYQVIVNLDEVEDAKKLCEMLEEDGYDAYVRSF